MTIEQQSILRIKTRSVFVWICFLFLASIFSSAFAKNDHSLAADQKNPVNSTSEGDLADAPFTKVPSSFSTHASDPEGKIIPVYGLVKKAPASKFFGLQYEMKSRHPSISDSAITTMLYLLWAVIILILIYTARHYYFTFNRLFGEQRHPYLDIDTGAWPTVTIFIPAHNEEAVIAHSLQALLEVDTPPPGSRRDS